MKRKLELLIEKCIECPICVLNPNTLNPTYYCAYDDANPIIKNTNKIHYSCHLVKMDKLEGLLDAINGVFKSFEFYDYIENPKDNSRLDEYDLMVKPLWKKLKQEYDKAKNIHTHIDTLNDDVRHELPDKRPTIITGTGHRPQAGDYGIK